MDYQSTLSYLYNSAPLFQQVGSAAYKEGLENTLIMDPSCRRAATVWGSIRRPIW